MREQEWNVFPQTAATQHECEQQETAGKQKMPFSRAAASPAVQRNKKLPHATIGSGFLHMHQEAQERGSARGAALDDTVRRTETVTCMFVVLSCASECLQASDQGETQESDQTDPTCSHKQGEQRPCPRWNPPPRWTGIFGLHSAGKGILPHRRCLPSTACKAHA